MAKSRLIGNHLCGQIEHRDTAKSTRTSVLLLSASETRFIATLTLFSQLRMLAALSRDRVNRISQPIFLVCTLEDLHLMHLYYQHLFGNAFFVPLTMEWNTIGSVEPIARIEDVRSFSKGHSKWTAFEITAQVTLHNREVFCFFERSILYRSAKDLLASLHWLTFIPWLQSRTNHRQKRLGENRTILEYTTASVSGNVSWTIDYVSRVRRWLLLSSRWLKFVFASTRAIQKNPL